MSISLLFLAQESDVEVKENGHQVEDEEEDEDEDESDWLHSK